MVRLSPRHRLALLLICCLEGAAAWSLPRFPASSETHLDRRSVIASIGAAAATITGNPLASNAASAKQPISESAKFDTYRIIPDPSAKLDPKLQKVDVSSFSSYMIWSIVAVYCSCILLLGICRIEILSLNWRDPRGEVRFGWASITIQ